MLFNAAIVILCCTLSLGQVPASFSNNLNLLVASLISFQSLCLSTRMAISVAPKLPCFSCVDEVATMLTSKGLPFNFCDADTSSRCTVCVEKDIMCIPVEATFLLCSVFSSRVPDSLLFEGPANALLCSLLPYCDYNFKPPPPLHPGTFSMASMA